MVSNVLILIPALSNRLSFIATDTEVRFGGMSQAFNNLIASKAKVDDSQLAYAILLALPPSFTAIAQALYFYDQTCSVLSLCGTQLSVLPGG